MEVQAQARWVRSTPRKVRFVADTLRGLPVAEALAACQFNPRSAARDVAKVIRSAQANAEHNFNLDKDDLVLKELRVEAGPILKRGQPRARGRDSRRTNRLRNAGDEKRLVYLAGNSSASLAEIMKIVIAPDKFKGSLTADQAAKAIAVGLRSVDPAIEIDLCPMADGGEGTVNALVSAMAGKSKLSTMTRFARSDSWIASTTLAASSAPSPASDFIST